MTEKGALVLIHWLDSVSSGRFWSHKEDVVRDGLEVESIGWVLFDDEKKITIAAHIGEHGVGGDITIPKCAITGIWEIEW